MKFILTIEENKRQDINVIASMVKKMGGKIETIINFSGIIIGYIKRNPEELRNVQGVKSVEIENKVSL